MVAMWAAVSRAAAAWLRISLTRPAVNSDTPSTMTDTTAVITSTSSTFGGAARNQRSGEAGGPAAGAVVSNTRSLRSAERDCRPRRRRAAWIKNDRATLTRDPAEETARSLGGGRVRAVQEDRRARARSRAAAHQAEHQR